MAFSSAKERVAFVEAQLAQTTKEVVGQTIYEPTGNHRVRLEIVGTPHWIEMNVGEAMQALEKLKRGIAFLTTEDARDRFVERTVRRGIE